MGALARVPSLNVVGRISIRHSLVGLLCAFGLFTVSWDRLANLGLGQYNIKLPVVLFTISALLGAPEWWRKVARWIRGTGVLRGLVLAAVCVIVLYSVRALFVVPILAGVAQIVALGTGAVAPALAVVAAFHTRTDIAWGLRWLLAGTVLAGAFGLWQLFAFYTGLPQLIAYTGVGTSGEGGRIAAFSYEPAYFAYFLVLAAGCRIALARITGVRVGFWSIGVFGVLFTLVNARSLLFLLPLAMVLLAIAWRAHRALLLRSAIAAALLGALSIAVPTAIDSLGSQPGASHTTPTSSRVTTTTTPSDAARARTEHSLAPTTARPGAPKTERSKVPTTQYAGTSPSRPPEVAPPQLPTNVLDPNEQSSNAPRLDLYKAVLRVDLQHAALGVGPGGLRAALAADGYVAPNQGAQVVANNVWLQAAADGGIPLLLLQAGLVVMVVVLWWRNRRQPEQPLLSVCIAVLFVGGMLTSYFFDVKLWVVMALAVVSAATGQRGSEEGQWESAAV